MTRPILRGLRWTLAVCALLWTPNSSVSAQRLSELRYRVEAAPWENPWPLPTCGTDLLVASSDRENRIRLFSSRDGVRWTREPIPDGLHISRTFCVEGVLWGIGYPGAIVRRDRGTWIAEHRSPPPAEGWLPVLEDLVHEPATRRLRVYGRSDRGRIELLRESSGAWAEVRNPSVPNRSGRAWPDPECVTSRRPSRPPRSTQFMRAETCSRGALLLWWTDPATSRPDALVLMPRAMRRHYWIVAGLRGSSVYLVSTQFDENWEMFRATFARYDCGRWEAATVEDTNFNRNAIMSPDGTVLFVGHNRLYRVEPPR